MDMGGVNPWVGFGWVGLGWLGSKNFNVSMQNMFKINQFINVNSQRLKD